MKKNKMKKMIFLLAMVSGTVLSLSGCQIAVTAPEAAPEAASETAPETTPFGEETGEELTISCDLFSITLPEAAAGNYLSETTENSIRIYDRESSEAGFGGFAFGVLAYREPSEYAGGIDWKVGEYKAADGTLYDIVMEEPTDVQWDYTASEEMPESFALLYNGSEEIVKTLTGIDGGSFAWGGGTKGEELYGEELKKHVTAMVEGWDGSHLEEEDMSPEYYMLSQEENHGLDRVGYIYMDVNYDGIEELLVGEIAEGEWKGIIYDIYTMVDRAPAHVLSGTARNRYYALEGGMLMNEYSGGALNSGFTTCDIEPNTTNLMPQVKLKYDGEEDAEQPWFVSYGEDETWEHMTEEEFEDRKNGLSQYNRFDYIPLSDVASDSE